MYIKRLAEIFVQKAFLIFEILSFEVYCRLIATLRINDTGVVNGDGRQTMHKSMNNYI